jgi:nicotinic acid mononucleotide adenylyltransferase
VTPVTVSSSLVRQHVLEGRGVEHLVSKKVGEYLKKHNLYDSKNLP